MKGTPASFSLAVVALIQAMGDSVRIQADLLSRQRAAMLAENIMEEMRLSGSFIEGTDRGEFEDEDAMYAWRTEVEPTDVVDLVEVTVIVTWDDGRGERDYSLSTLILNRESL